MSHKCCPHGLLSNKSSTVPLSKSSFQLFIFIQMMKLVSSDTKVCHTCRTVYYNWKTSNPEFGDILSGAQSEYLKNIDINRDTYSVTEDNDGIVKAH